ncbi:MAG: M15 family metallopeptidase [Rhizobiaceae bacterium]
MKTVLAAIAVLFVTAPAIAGDLPAGFVRLADIDATIRQDMRYAGSLNFLGRPAAGYEAPACILTEEAASALSRVQARLAAESLTLVVFDCYRPQRAVDDFMAWVRGGKGFDARWHPRVSRQRLRAEGYIAGRSGHSRGSTVDLAIAGLGRAAPSDPTCGAMGAATLDFGTGFDCFDDESRTASKAIPAAARDNRRLLVETMRAEGFVNYSREWWHFTLADEPQRKRFDFPVTD